MKFNLKGNIKLIAGVACGVLLFAGTFMLTDHLVTNEVDVIDFIKGLKSNKTEEIVEDAELKKQGLTEEQCDIVHDVHNMSNAVICAIDGRKFEIVDPSPDRLDSVIDRIEAQDNFLTDILPILKEWRQGNFTDAVKVHNHVWDMLGGTMGKAYLTDHSAIETLKNTYDYTIQK